MSHYFPTITATPEVCQACAYHHPLDYHNVGCCADCRLKGECCANSAMLGSVLDTSKPVCQEVKQRLLEQLMEAKEQVEVLTAAVSVSGQPMSTTFAPKPPPVFKADISGKPTYLEAEAVVRDITSRLEQHLEDTDAVRCFLTSVAEYHGIFILMDITARDVELDAIDRHATMMRLCEKDEGKWYQGIFDVVKEVAVKKW